MKHASAEQLIVLQKTDKEPLQHSEPLPSSTSDKNLHEDHNTKYYQIKKKNMKPYTIINIIIISSTKEIQFLLVCFFHDWSSKIKMKLFIFDYNKSTCTLYQFTSYHNTGPLKKGSPTIYSRAQVILLNGLDINTVLTRASLQISIDQPTNYRARNCWVALEGSNSIRILCSSTYLNVFY